MENRTSKRPSKVGVVVSNSMDKTIVVEIATLVKHPDYHKMIKRTIRIKAHDENNQANIASLKSSKKRSKRGGFNVTNRKSFKSRRQLRR